MLTLVSVCRWQTLRPCGDVAGGDCRLLCIIMCLYSLERKEIEIKCRSIAPLRKSGIVLSPKSAKIKSAAASKTNLNSNVTRDGMKIVRSYYVSCAVYLTRPLTSLHIYVLRSVALRVVRKFATCLQEVSTDFFCVVSTEAGRLDDSREYVSWVSRGS